jgi:thiol-disulfide isomerase/thioredoxin
MLKKSAFYIFAAIFIFAGQFLASSGVVTGTPPKIEQATLTGNAAMPLIAKGPALIYFWAEWCGICRSIQGNVDAVLRDYPAITVAVRSGNNEAVIDYMNAKQIAWPTVNDRDGNIGQLYGVSAVPALLFLNGNGDIVFSSVGYTSEWGMRFRLWLTGFV